MSFDGLFTRAMVHELQRLVGARIHKVHQPYKLECILQIRGNGISHKLLLSAHPSFHRVQLTEESYENPKEPPMFCMLLRKHVEGGVIEAIEQQGLDRIITFQIKSRNELGDWKHKLLIIELMGRHSNLLLVDPEKMVILDCIKHIPSHLNRHRTLLPGYPYVAPPVHEKMNPLDATEEDVLKKIDFNSGKLPQQLVQKFEGLSPMIAKEIVSRVPLANRVTLPNMFIHVMKPIRQHQYSPSIMVGQDKEAFYFMPLLSISSEYQSFSSLSELLDRYYFGKAERDRIKQIAADLERVLQQEKRKNENKIEKLLQTLEEAKEADRYQLYGELLTANLYRIEKGMEEVEVENYYSEEAEKIVISLKKTKSPADNAQSYFSKYQKLKHAADIVQEQIGHAKAEIEYLDVLIQQLENAAPKDVEEIREELVEEGYLKAKQDKGKKKNKPQNPTLETYVSSDGTEILVGKNNKQNDYLTNRVAKKDEIWLHTKDIPGSHVVIKSAAPSDETILEAARLAAYFSKARNSSSVPVDFTKVRHVKKPSGAKPGFVIYEQQQTVYVTPDEAEVMKLRR
ncbi:predicted ribosome quality control (RQC) complex YloA/Tae2 family protein [Bacillus oleivorans]|uniref:Rqc2 homolog RqcH n=1 Tax=Bacillus oleivorans TaxID=1448271 RepID=A0A285D132_9BACI|nr:NFACT RNA binding domain-containing protein [Bacillus oleivorans]SNX73521.1 predicted ribosome quality control (RQC) complex YloA/Tae2 family protein [Bacillus oleivorans]